MDKYSVILEDFLIFLHKLNEEDLMATRKLDLLFKKIEEIEEDLPEFKKKQEEENLVEILISGFPQEV